MPNLPFTNRSVKTPMERIFEKVMLRKMTEEEKEILELNESVKKKGSKEGVSRKKAARLTEDDGLN